MNHVALPSSWVNPLFLETARPGVTMSQVTIDDAPDFLNSWRRSEADIVRFDPNTAGMYDCLEDIEAAIYRPGRLEMGTWDGDRFVAGGNLRQSKEAGVWLLGCWTDSQETGNGYGTLTAQTLIAYAAGRIPVLRAEIIENNAASVHIVEKLGLERTGKKVGQFSVFELVTPPKMN